MECSNKGIFVKFCSLFRLYSKIVIGESPVTNFIKYDTELCLLSPLFEDSDEWVQLLFLVPHLILVGGT